MIFDRGWKISGDDLAGVMKQTKQSRAFSAVLHPEPRVADHGKTIGEILEPDKLIEEIKKDYEQLFKAIIKIIKDYVENGGVGDIVLEGSAKILGQPEYANVEKARAMLELLEAKDQLVPMLKSPENVSLNIKIGKDNEMGKGMPECAIVTANYQVNGVSIGNAGVIGPIRMDYSKVVSVLDYIGKTLNVLPEADHDEKHKQ